MKTTIIQYLLAYQVTFQYKKTLRLVSRSDFEFIAEQSNLNVFLQAL